MADSADLPTVLPLEHIAPIYVESRNGYVDVQQPSGDPTLYTPQEARDIAREILAAAEEAEAQTERAPES
jgi:hypothetical protein